MKVFAPGDVVLSRGPSVDDSIRGGGPEICDVKPVVVVQDDPALVSLFLPAGTQTKFCGPLRSSAPGPWRRGEWRLVDSVWDRWNTLHLIAPADWFATWVMWTPEWEFLGWYVNIQEPLRRTNLGFDVRDLQLDVLVAPNRTWRWKDEDELERAVSLGVISEATAGKTRDAAAVVVASIESGRWPFESVIADWRPDLAWPTPELPAGDAWLNFEGDW